MKLSMRGKSVRRRRHTKRTGKNLRYKGKKVRASKRYHRGIGDRGHTKKTHRKIYRGRVKKGGVDEEHWEKLKWTDVVGEPSKKQATGRLVYKKDSTFSLTSESKYFLVTLETTQSDLIKTTNLYFMKFKVTMERYKDGNNGYIDKVFEVYFDFGYTPPSQNLIDYYGYMSLFTRDSDQISYSLTQVTEDGKPITQSLSVYHPAEKINQTVLRNYMPAVVNPNTNRVSINLPEKFSNIKGYDDISNKLKSDNYIFYGSTISLMTNWPDDDKSNTAFFNSLATQMYRILNNAALATPQ